jgi:hypothetical protein
MLSVLHVGFHKNVTDRLILGARAKIYMSSFNATSNKIYLYRSGWKYDITSDFFRYAIEHLRISEYISEGYNGDAAGDIRKNFIG